jgi:putative cell wall-binding protein
MSESNGNSRLDRIERTLEKLSGTAYDHGKVIAANEKAMAANEKAMAAHEKAMADHETALADQKAAIVYHERVLKQIEETQLRFAEAHIKLAKAQKVTENKMIETTKNFDALIKTVDDVIRKRPEGRV